MAYQEPTTIGELRSQLIAKDIPPPSAEQLTSATEEHGRNRIIAAIKVLHCEPDRAQGARAFLNRCFGPDKTISQAQPPVNANSPEPERDPHFDPADDAPAADDPGDRQYGDGPPSRTSLHVYGGRAALCFEASRTRRDVPTVTMDAAPSNAPKTYDWKNKTTVQFTVDELPFVLAVFLGIVPSCEYKSHGANKDKGFRFEAQDGGKIFAKVFSPDGVCAVPITRADSFHVSRLLLSQLKAAGRDDLAGTEVLALLRAVMAR